MSSRSPRSLYYSRAWALQPSISSSSCKDLYFLINRMDLKPGCVHQELHGQQGRPRVVQDSTLRTFNILLLPVYRFPVPLSPNLQYALCIFVNGELAFLFLNIPSHFMGFKTKKFTFTFQFLEFCLHFFREVVKNQNGFFTVRLTVRRGAFLEF